ncbi:SH3 domain-binding protein 5 homolog [Orussus abietinus]|uniref:SH3 domain-binding protein 5 homolog n=1 Tax=Orussus abietinus TaxID=222816 RepID=UPI000625A63F|nr:SH3 domain-binding protein 5 homolog [Orussus abietinus]
MDVADAEGPLDPRIQVELENLNNATDEINKLEIELDEAHTAFKQLLSDSTRRLKEIANKLGGGCIEKARCYYEAMEVARQARIQCQRQAQLYQRASEIHAAAKETVALAEARFLSHQHEWNFDQAWQDMLNHATIKVMDAENQKAECGREHQRRASLFHDADVKAQQLEEKHHRAIIKAKPYFEVRAQCDQMLAMQKERVECLQKGVRDAKQAYAASLRALEEISNQIHERRRDYDMVVSGPREPGVGAELISSADSLNYDAELNKVNVSRINSLASSEPDTDDRAQDFEDVLELKQRMDQLGSRSVDGSESTSSQWELELQASMEKLNNIPLRKSNFEANKDCRDSKLESSTPQSISPLETHVKDLPEASRNESNRSRTDFKSLKRSFARGVTLPHYQGWQSLTQSPINSILSRSKIALKNSISKSLTNSPVNLGNFSFGETLKTTNAKAKPSIVETTKSNADDKMGSEVEESRGHRNRLENKSNQNREDSNENFETVLETKNSSEIIVPADQILNLESLEKSLNSDADNDKNCVSGSNRLRLQHKSDSRGFNDTGDFENKTFLSRSVNVTPTRSRTLVELKKSSKSFDNGDTDGDRESIMADRQVRSAKELPLLSIFECSVSSKTVMSKSCSMVNLAEKRNLMALLDSSKLGNIHAVSVERLANARHNLVGESSEPRNEYPKK